VPRKDEYKTTLVKRGASIGANSTVVCGITLGCYCFVGAGSVVTRDVPDYAMVYGNPARVRGWLCNCGEKLAFSSPDEEASARCAACGRRYNRSGQLVREIA
jgi:UDP-2-acetamido-3-amino-2,3-dideoxy-glucuronate N-acetyltransferase